MNGSLRHFEDGEDDPPYDRLCLDFADGHHLAYVNPRLLGRVGLARDAAEFIAPERLGPDALNPRFDLAAFERALAGRKRNLKSVLMDQEVVAGIGNVYSDEILFQARLHPRTRSDWLDAATRERLFRQINEVLETAMAHGAGTERLIDRLPSSFLIPHRQKGWMLPPVRQQDRHREIFRTHHLLLPALSAPDRMTRRLPCWQRDSRCPVLLKIYKTALLRNEEHFRDFLDEDQSADGSARCLIAVEPLHGAQQCPYRSSRSF
jgi:hypothetical protein